MQTPFGFFPFLVSIFILCIGCFHCCTSQSLYRAFCFWSSLGPKNARRKRHWVSSSLYGEQKWGSYMREILRSKETKLVRFDGDFEPTFSRNIKREGVVLAPSILHNENIYKSKRNYKFVSIFPEILSFFSHSILKLNCMFFQLLKNEKK